MKLLKLDIVIDREGRNIEISLFYLFIEDRQRWRYFAKDDCYLRAKENRNNCFFTSLL